jgi:RsiW-degrading membrane proteinase PrsW (M82 family)
MLWTTMYSYLQSFFIYEGLGWKLLLVSIGLSVAFGAIWLCAHWIPLLKRPSLLVVMVAGAILTLIAIVFVQIPLQYYSSKALSHFWNNETLSNWLLLAGLPSVLITGLVQEGAKMLPVVAWWGWAEKEISPKLGLAIGAAAGAGFGILEAIWSINQGFMAGWTTQYISQYGFLGIAAFWERFFIIGFHAALGALVGYGLAKGKGWLFYLFAALLHALMNYSIIVFQYFTYVRGSELITPTRLEIAIAVLAGIVTAIIMILRWRKNGDEMLLETVTPEGELSLEPVPPENPPETPPQTVA